jgi:hypothetical protein
LKTGHLLLLVTCCYRWLIFIPLKLQSERVLITRNTAMLSTDSPALPSIPHRGARNARIGHAAF